MKQAVVTPQFENIALRQPRPGLFIAATLVMISTVSIGFFVEREMLAGIMFYIQQKTLPPFGEFYPYQLLLTVLFAFGLPLGVLFLLIFVVRRLEVHPIRRRRLIVAGVLLFFLAILIPALFGRETSKWFFGTGGFAIMTGILLTFWFISLHMVALRKEIRSGLEFKILGYVCFGMVTWHICGFSNAPGFAMFPDKMIEFGVQPFAIGQLKSVMAYMVFGWLFTAIGHYKSYTHKTEANS
jgi:hypothetical protein